MSYNLSPGEVLEPEPSATEPEEWYENLNRRMICPDCKEDPPNLFEDSHSGDTGCASCGVVLDQRGIDTRAEWRTFANDDQGNDDPSRVGEAANPLLNGNQLQTSIAFGDGSLRSKELHRAQNKSNLDKNNKALLQAFKQIGTFCDARNLPLIVSDGAKHIYKEADDSKMFKGKSQDALVAGCIFLACRRNNFGRSFRELHELTKVSKKEIGRTFKLLESFLQKSDKSKAQKTTVVANGVVALNESYQATATTSPADLCARFCSMLGLDQRCTNVATDLANKMATVGTLAGRSPLSGAAACIYMASYLMGQGRTPKQISEAAKVSDSTIRNAYKSLYNDREALIEKQWLDKGGKLADLPKPS